MESLIPITARTRPKMGQSLAETDGCGPWLNQMSQWEDGSYRRSIAETQADSAHPHLLDINSFNSSRYNYTTAFARKVELESQVTRDLSLLVLSLHKVPQKVLDEFGHKPAIVA